jgi:hypothetical protein
MFGKKKPKEHAELDELDPQAIALAATLAELRKVADDLQKTNAAFKETVATLKEDC